MTREKSVGMQPKEHTDTKKMQSFHADEIIMREGTRCDTMYKVLSGSVAVYVRYGEKDEHLIGIYSKHRCFGEMNVLSEELCTYTVVAYDEVLLMRITRDYLEEFIQMNPKNVLDIMKSMGQSMIVMQKNIDLLLDDINAKAGSDKEKNAMLQEKIRHYQMQGLINGLVPRPKI